MTELPLEFEVDEALPFEIEMSDREAAGRMIVGMSLGEIPIPQSNEEALALFAEHGITIQNFDCQKEIRFVSRDEALYIVLPPSDLMRRRIERYRDHVGPYPLPDQYREQVQGDPNALDPMEMFYFRVGDFSFGGCR